MPMYQENPFFGLIIEYKADSCQIYAILSGFPSEKWKKTGPTRTGRSRFVLFMANVDVYHAYGPIIFNKVCLKVTSRGPQT